MSGFTYCRENGTVACMREDIITGPDRARGSLFLHVQVRKRRAEIL
jgi:hypothetical protein